ncbi:septal ring lytic transglycosylase RlpA family protein [Parazoarcus communis]
MSCRGPVTAALLAAATLLLSACGQTPVRPSGSQAQTPDAGQTASSAKSGRRGGGYYKDDGPHDTPPSNLEAVPDASPRLEPLHRFANRPYTVFGQDYVPLTELAPYRERGRASWYGRRFHGQPTSSGEPYDMYAMTAAHPTLPIPSYARVTSLATGNSVVVRVNDRGPFHKDRLMDLSYTAAYKLGYINQGSTEVEVEQILPDELPMVASADPVPPLTNRDPPRPVVTPAVAVAPRPLAPVQQLSSAGSGVFLQLGAFASFDNAEGFRATIEEQMSAFADRLELFADGSRFRLHAGPYASVDEARSAADRIAAALNMKPFVVVR